MTEAACEGGPGARPGVVQLTDTLAAGGLERMVVTIANALPRDLFRSHVIATRRGGPLERTLAPHVGWHCLERQWRFDLSALRRLALYLRQHAIDLIHAHGTSLFLALLGARFTPHPHPKVIWHDHYGRHHLGRRSTALYRPAAHRVDAVIAVTDALAAWSTRELSVPAHRVRHVPNFVDVDGADGGGSAELPGAAGSRIACVANARPEKNHRGLLQAMQLVVREVPSAHLLLLGPPPSGPGSATIRDDIAALGLSRSVSVLDSGTDVLGVLRGCDVGVLASISEGFPLALLEYGVAGLATVATDVGRCADVLGHGRAGLVVPAGCTPSLTRAIVQLLQCPDLRLGLAARLRERVGRIYSREAVLPKICEVYDFVLRDGRPGARR